MSSTPAPRRPDWFAAFAQGTFVTLAAALVFGFAWALAPAIETQKAAPCRPLDPEAQDRPAPDFQATDLDGHAVSLADLRGKYVVLNFWATWCEPCVQEWPELDQLAERLTDRDDVVVVALSVDEDPKAVREFLDRMSLSQTKVQVWWAPKKEGTPGINDRYGSPKLPDTYFIDRAGKIQQVYVNTRRWGTAQAARCLRVMADRAGEK